ncbi:MAG TPA: dihydrolipoamide acetyltransferase family protein [Xanthobacteraceae bacterium]
MDVLMPQLGETVAEGKITQWFKSAGDPIAPGDNLFEIETDKVSMEVPSTTTGVLAEIRVAAGAVAPVGAVVAVISDGTAVRMQDNAPQSYPQPPPTPPFATTVTIAPPPAGEGKAQGATPPGGPAMKLDPFFEVRTPARNYGPARISGGTTVTPLARRLAIEGGIDLGRVRGSGSHGRVTARDIDAARSAAPKAAPAAWTGISSPSAEEIAAIYRDVAFKELPLDGMRSAIARRMVASKQSIPHFYLTADVAIGALLELREAANAAAPKDADGQPAFKLSVTDLLIKAWAAALHRMPAANAVFANDRILQFERCDIAVAVAIEGGLIAPVLRRAEAKMLSQISNEMKDLVARARARKLEPREYQGGVSAITNLGMYGVREFSAIIVPPQSSILAVGSARRQAVENAAGSIAFASMLSVTLSCDHRVLDGVLGAELLAAFKGMVEQPVAMLV